MQLKPIYLDYNATTPVDPEVLEAMFPYLKEHFGNPSSNHVYGHETRKAIENAREQLAALLNCHPEELIFTSGGTESNNYALKGSAFHLKNKGRHIITSCIEHPAITEVCHYLETQGFVVSYLPVDPYGMVSTTELEKAIRPDTILISIMHANNEIGTIQPIEEIGKIALARGICFHSDAAQSVGKIKTDVCQMGVNLLSVAGHKLYGPKGIGALYIKNGTRLEKFMHGASHEKNLRAGTENVAYIVALGKAAEIALRDFDSNQNHMKNLRDFLEKELKSEIPDIHINGHPENRLPNTSSISFPGVEANKLLAKMTGLAASAGAACHSKGVTLSEVLKAIRLNPEIAKGTLRFSTGRYLDISQIIKAVEMIVSATKNGGFV